MDKPRGKDKLGRFVYAGDIVTDSFGNIWRIKERLYEPYLDLDPLCYSTSWLIWTESGTINLEASPKRSNYERYFADMGTLEEVLCLSRTEAGLSCEWDCEGCPFLGWGTFFGVPEHPLYCVAFAIWLRRNSVI